MLSRMLNLAIPYHCHKAGGWSFCYSDCIHYVTGKNNFNTCNACCVWWLTYLILDVCLGASSEELRCDLAKLKSLSSIHRAELIEAAKRTFCYRSAVISTTAATFAECVASIPCYITIPTIVSMAWNCCLVLLCYNCCDRYITAWRSYASAVLGI